MTAKARGKLKKPTIGVSLPSKGPRAEHKPEENLKKKACWAISRIEQEGKWGWDNITSGELWSEIVTKLTLFEGMTWGEILQGGKSHYVEINKINSEAKRKLVELDLDDSDNLFSLRLTAKRRIWGILENGVLKILWYDPNHEVCPVYLKHT